MARITIIIHASGDEAESHVHDDALYYVIAHAASMYSVDMEIAILAVDTL